MIKIEKANSYQDFEIIEKLARCILHEHYDPIIPKKHTQYFINKYQTAKKIEEQVKMGQNYYKLNYNEKSVGYLGVIIETYSLVLDKLYILKKHRGKKIGKAAMQFVDRFAIKNKISNANLIVNIENYDAIEFYEAFGYQITKKIPNHFETGQVIENYKMEKVYL